MFCESYREALSEAALRGEPLPSAAEAHLGICDSCRAAFKNEQALFGSIESGLHSIANAEVPASLLAGVRARVAQGAPTTAWTTRSWSWSKWAWGAAVLSLVIALSLLVAGKREVRREGGATITAMPPKIGTDESRLTEKPILFAQETPTKAVTKKRENRAAKKVSPRGREEVLVNGEDLAGLEQYLVRFKNRGISEATARGLVAVNEEPAFQIEPLEIEEMRWPHLAIEPLESGSSR